MPEWSWSHAYRWVVALLVIVLVGCPRVAPTGLSGGAIAAITGQVDFPAGRQVQATVGEVANAATVSLIDPATNVTIASSVTDASGSFKLTFGAFTPGSTPYYLEAVKGLSAGGTSNRVGASAARVRTLIQWSGGTWQSISAGSITVSYTTTALSIIASLRGSSVSVPALIGSLTMGTQDSTLSPSTPDTFSPGSSNVTNAEFHSVYQLAANALTLDQDPFQVVYRLPDGTYQRTSQDSNVVRLSPTSLSIGSTLTIYGQNFATPASNNVVTFAGGVTAAASSVSADRTQMTVTVPVGACSGPVSFGTTTGDLTPTIGYVTVTNAPLAGTRFVGINSGSVNADTGPLVRVLAQQPNTNVTYRNFLTSGSIDYASTRTLVASGSTWEFNVSADTLGMFQITSDKPVFVSYDNIAVNASDNEWACQTGTDYYFRLPGTFGGYQLISHAANNPVTVTCLNDATQNASQTLGAGATLGRTSTPNAASSYWYHVQSASQTTVIYGAFSSNASTQVYSPDMTNYFEAHMNSGSAGSYQLVGYQNGTTVTVTDLSTSTTATYNLSAGQRISQTFAATGLVRTQVVSNYPVGFYITDNGRQFEANQHSSVDQLGSIGKSYQIVSPDRAPTHVYVLSLAPGNTITMSGGLTGTTSLDEFAWKDMGVLAADTGLAINASQSIAVFTSDNLWTQDYTLLPY